MKIMINLNLGYKVSQSMSYRDLAHVSIYKYKTTCPSLDV